MEIIRFETHKICNGRNGGLELELYDMDQANVDLVLLQETKITDGVYARDSAGFCIFASDTLIRHCGGMALFYKYFLRFVVVD